jgi:hypothetical protein
MVPPARHPTHAREIESGFVSDVESPARRRRVTLNLNSQGGGEQRADGVPAAAREGEANGKENEVNRDSVNHPDGDGSGNSVNQRVEGLQLMPVLKEWLVQLHPSFLWFNQILRDFMSSKTD